jgi:cellulose synthase (UDP-forming)
VALVQAPQTFYNAGAFDDDGGYGEQGLFFNVLMPARHAAGAGPFWVGSTSLLRLAALQEIGGVATETITEDMHTTLKLIRAGWRTVYHHQVLAVGLAPATADQYLVQRRRWGMGAMQVLAHERLWAAKRWMSWRDFYEYLNGTLWWLEGVATIVAFAVPVAVMVSGATTSSAPAWAFVLAFSAMFTARLWGAKRLLRGQIHWPTAFALRIFRIPIGLACLWWLLCRRSLTFQVTPKGGADQRLRGSAPGVLWALAALVGAVSGYAVAGVLGVVPWRAAPASTVASGAWLALAAVVLALGLRRIRALRYATSRRNAHRVAVRTPVLLAGARGELVDISAGGASVHLTGRGRPTVPPRVQLVLPNSSGIHLQVVRVIPDEDDRGCVVTLQAQDSDWAAHRSLSLWLFHTPDGSVPGLPAGVPAAALRQA